MAMFLSRIKKALNLGTKSITVNGTYNASSDGYDGYSSVEVNVAGVTPTPITPSNSNPVALTSGSAVTPSANGYAIASYNTKTPSNSSPVALASGEIDKIGGNGYAIESYSSVTPTSVPSTQASGFIKLNGNASIVDIINSLIPYAVPQNVNAGETYHFDSSGVVVDYIGSKTPSDTSPPLISQGEPNIPTANGYLYSTVQPKVKTGTVTLSTSSTTKVTLGFRPKYLCAYSTYSYYSNIWIDTMASNKYIRATSSGPLMKDWNSNYTGGLVSIDDDGFTLRTSTSSAGLTYQYFAIG